MVYSNLLLHLSLISLGDHSCPLPIYVTGYQPTHELCALPIKNPPNGGFWRNREGKKLRSARVAGYGHKGFVTGRTHEDISQRGHSHHRNLYQGRPGLLAHLNSQMIPDLLPLLRNQCCPHMG